ncbi:hypothetical protein H4R18_005297 [Coemansia javaensis]|uniref:Uncharacterized protein n=1 Tax=Coemansia javaensis TaxID=2761396 RepID=A0A9W8H3L2_9FUNG|nr:hypothetical protein H4R18_005297 [Coemansia javaensis]
MVKTVKIEFLNAQPAMLCYDKISGALTRNVGGRPVAVYPRHTTVTMLINSVLHRYRNGRMFENRHLFGVRVNSGAPYRHGSSATLDKLIQASHISATVVFGVVGLTVDVCISVQGAVNVPRFVKRKVSVTDTFPELLRACAAASGRSRRTRLTTADLEKLTYSHFSFVCDNRSTRIVEVMTHTVVDLYSRW